MANSAVVGILRTLLTSDASGYVSGFAKATQATEKQTQAEEKLRQESAKLTPQAERMAKAFGGDKLLYSANNLVAAITRVGGATKLTTEHQTRSNATLKRAIEQYAVLGKEAPAAMLAAEKATRGASSATSVLGSAFATLTASFSTALIVNRIVGGLTSLANEAIKSAGELVDLSAKTGLSTVTLQQMGHVAGQTSSTLEDFTNAAFKLGVNISTGSTAVKAAFAELARSSDKLGMSFEQFQKLSQDEQWKRVAAALHDVSSEQDRNRLGVILAGRAYGNVAAAISQDYNKIASDAKVAGDAQVRAIDDAADAWTKFIHDVGISIQTSLGNAVIRMNATKQAMKELGILASERAIQERANDIIALGILKTRDKDIELTQQSARAQISYRQQLAAVQAELQGLTSNQRAEIDAALKLGVSQADLEQQYGLSEGALRILSEQTKDYTKANKDAAKSAEELRDNIAALSTDVFGIADKLEASFDKIADAEMFQNLKDEINGLADDMTRIVTAGELTAEEIDQLRNITKVQRDSARVSAQITQDRTSFEIERAKAVGDNWREVYALEQNLSRQRRDAAIADVQAEFAARTEALRARLAERPNAIDQTELNAETRLMELQIQQIMEDFNLAERERADAIRRTHNIWVRSWMEMRTTSDQVIGSISSGIARLERDLTGNLTSLIFGFDPEHDPTGELRKAADEAKIQYDKIKKSGTATAKELQQAFKAWHEAEDRANVTFGERFKAVWVDIQVSIKNILNDLLKYYTERFIVGLISGLHLFRGKLSALNYIPAGAPAAIPFIPGIGSQKPPAINAPQPQNPNQPPPTGIVPIPPATPGGGGHVPTPPAISNLSIPRFQMSNFDLGGFIPPGVIQPAMLHGPEWVIPDAKMPAAMAAQSNVRQTYITIEGVMDSGNFKTLLRTEGFDEIADGVFFNTNRLATKIRKAIDR